VKGFFNPALCTYYWQEMTLIQGYKITMVTACLFLSISCFILLLATGKNKLSIANKIQFSKGDSFSTLAFLIFLVYFAFLCFTDSLLFPFFNTHLYRLGANMSLISNLFALSEVVNLIAIVLTPFLLHFFRKKTCLVSCYSLCAFLAILLSFSQTPAAFSVFFIMLSFLLNISGVVNQLLIINKVGSNSLRYSFIQVAGALGSMFGSEIGGKLISNMSFSGFHLSSISYLFILFCLLFGKQKRAKAPSA
jgi:predicted MFS family arabinose efflux permease